MKASPSAVGKNVLLMISTWSGWIACCEKAAYVQCKSKRGCARFLPFHRSRASGHRRTLLANSPCLCSSHRPNGVICRVSRPCKRYLRMTGVHTMSSASSPKAFAAATIWERVYRSSLREGVLMIDVSAQSASSH